MDWYCSEPRLAFNRIVVLRYRSHLESRRLAPATINLRLGAVRRLAYEAADCGLLSSDLVAGIRRVKGLKKNGVRMGNWLTDVQARSLWQSPDDARMKGKRDRALLALLLACGLRRHEAASLRVEDLQQREDHWAIVDLVGKAGHIRTVRCPIGCTWNCLPGSVLLRSIAGRSFGVSAVRVECSGMASVKRLYGTWYGLRLRKSVSLPLRRTT